MELHHGLHLAYCTNIHRGESWGETFLALKNHTLAVRARVCPDQPYAIGLRLGAAAARELGDPAALVEFRRWLEANQCYVFTINGFPYGQFHGTRVKERVYAPDWTASERLDYTCRLFDLLAELLPAGIPGSVSTLPGSFKDFIHGPEQLAGIRKNLWRCVDHIAELSKKTGCELHLGLEPEPLCVLENSREVVSFFEQLRADRPQDDRLDRHLGLNYDTCHLAVEFEKPAEALARLCDAGIKISKIHLSSALKTHPTNAARAALLQFADPIYLHQVVARDVAGKLSYHRDLPEALSAMPAVSDAEAALMEWRIHFHVPLHAPAMPPFANTNDHLLGVLDALAAHPGLCRHLEMETYTWEVLPAELRSRNVVDQLVAEYAWTLERMGERGFVAK